MINSTGLFNRRHFLTSLAALGVASLTTSVYGLGATASKKLKLGFDNFSVVLDAINEIQHEGILLESMNVVEPTLEDVFLQLTMKEVTP